MKLTIEKSVKEEIEVNFPLSFKNGTAFYHCKNEKEVIAIYTTSKDIISTGFYAISRHYSPENVCTKEEVQAEFSKVVKAIQGIL